MPSSPSLTAVITRAEAARRLFVHPNTVTKYVERGWLRAEARPSGVKRYDPIDVEILGDKIRRHEMPPRERTDMNVTREALLHYRDKWTLWLSLLHTTDSERELARLKIALIDKELQS